MTRSLALALLLTVVAGGTACRRPLDESASRPERPRASRNDPYLIEAEELKSVDAQNLYEVVRIRRPAWLTKTVKTASGDEAVVVYLDDRKLGLLPVLRDLRQEVAARLRYLSPTEAQIRFGPTHGSLAAIVVEIK